MVRFGRFRNLWLVVYAVPVIGIWSQEPAIDQAPRRIRSYFERAMYDSAIAQSSEALIAGSATDSLAAALNLVAKCHYYLGRFDQALDLYQKILAKPLGDPIIRARLHINQSEVLIETTRYTEAGAQLSAADHLLDGLEQPSLKAMAMSLRGIILMRTSDYARALICFDSALTYARRSGEPRRVSMVLTNKATLYYYSGRYNEALLMYEDVLRIDMEENRSIDLAVDYGNIGNTYLQLKDMAKCLEYFAKSKEAYSSLGDSAGLSYVLGNMSLAYIILGQYEKAKNCLDEALRIAGMIGDRLGEAEWLYALGLIDFKKTNYRQALKNYGSAAELFKELESAVSYGLTLVEIGKCLYQTGETDSAEKSFLDAVEILSTDEGSHELWHPHYQLARLYEGWGRIQKADSLFAESIRCIEEARQTLDHSLTTFFMEDDRIDVYRSYVLHLIHRNRVEEAASILEKSKARNLSDLLTARKSQDTHLKNPADSLTIVQYFLHPEGSYVFIRSSESFRVRSISSRSIVNELTVDYLALIRRPGAKKDLHYIAQRLYDAVWRPFEKEIADGSTVVVIPDETLYYLPFESLHDGAQYLIEKCGFIYDPSFRVAENVMSGRKGGYSSILILARSNYASSTHFRTEHLNDLVFVDQEVEYIRGHFPHRATVCLNDGVTERALAERISEGKSIIHIAAHGVNDSEKPLRSSIILFNPDSAQDGKLSVDEIQSLRLDGQLVVLSACNTSLGKLLKGEGMLGLTRAFLAAGASSVVSSMWQVYDKSTSEFMKLFYESLVSERTSISQAARTAKIRMIHSETWSDPCHWAPFVVWGAGF